MIYDFGTLLLANAILVPVIVGLVSIAKGFLTSSRLAPLIAVILGVGIEFLGSGFVPVMDIKTTILMGIIAGLAASGLYSGVKTTTTPL